MSLQWYQQMAVLILGGGGAAAIYTLAKSWIAIRQSVDVREDKAISNLEKWRVESDVRANKALRELDFQRRLTNFWSNRAAQLERVLITHGVEYPACPPEPEPPADIAV